MTLMVGRETVTVRYVDLVGFEDRGDFCGTLFAADGTAITVGPSDWRAGAEALEQLRRRVLEHLVFQPKEDR